MDLFRRIPEPINPSKPSIAPLPSQRSRPPYGESGIVDTSKRFILCSRFLEVGGRVFNRNGFESSWDESLLSSHDIVTPEIDSGGGGSGNGGKNKPWPSLKSMTIACAPVYGRPLANEFGRLDAAQE
ncbi:hypothetical protein BGZ95_008023 [Linnemannia exigua]|uniref:Uncharacterized protein n=1 Tax=Linnemannia exigua TaxID=604196 RepID=A0AAD4H8Q5_9FUNG|nr:hypothetical protein BGZ95_008023 [Linnemannia exigua]